MIYIYIYIVYIYIYIYIEEKCKGRKFHAKSSEEREARGGTGRWSRGGGEYI